MIPRQALLDAAFWHQDICLSCGDTTERQPGTPPAFALECDECGESSVIDPIAFLAAEALIEEEEE